MSDADTTSKQRAIVDLGMVQVPNLGDMTVYSQEITNNLRTRIYSLEQIIAQAEGDISANIVMELDAAKHAVTVIENALGEAINLIDGLGVAATMLKEQRDTAIAKRLELQAEVEERENKAYGRGYEDGQDAADEMNFYDDYYEPEIDYEQASQIVASDLENDVNTIARNLRRLGEEAAAAELEAQLLVTGQTKDSMDEMLDKYRTEVFNRQGELRIKLHEELEEERANQNSEQAQTEE